MSTHHDFTATVNAIAHAHWGKDFSNIDDAQKKLVSDVPSLTAFALVELLRRFNAVARAVGEDIADDEDEGFQKIDNPLEGLSVGDVVYSFDEDDDEIDEDRVIAVVDGIGYFLQCTRWYGPRLWPVNCIDYATSHKEAIERNREKIVKSTKYFESQVSKLAGLKSMLEE